MTATTRGSDGRPASWFQRYLLPGFAFKAVIIGGGYATGRELAEFFMPHGPWGGLGAMILATILWSLIAAMTFAVAHVYGTYDYRGFFQLLLGPGWIVFEIAYIVFVTLILSVFGAAAGAIGNAIFGLPSILGTLALCCAIALFAAFGNSSVERLFKYVSFLLYAVYAVFLVLALSRFGDRIAANFALQVPDSNWALGGITYAGYNVIGAVVILPVTRHLSSRRDAIISGIVAGPLAMAPAILFFVSMIAFFPSIANEVLPSDFMLRHMGSPLFHLLFQAMIFAALLESGTGAVHAINERISSVRERRGQGPLRAPGRGAIATVLLLGCVFAAQHFGLVTLIATGYRALALIFILIYVVPLLTIGSFRLVRSFTPAGQRQQSATTQRNEGG